MYYLIKINYMTVRNYLGNAQIDRTVSPGSVNCFWISSRLLDKKTTHLLNCVY